MRTIFAALLTVQKKISWLLLFSIISLFFVGWLIYANKKNLAEKEYWVNHTYEVIEKLHQVNVLIAEKESATRKLLIGDSTDFKNLLFQVQRQLKIETDQIKVLTKDNPVQQAYLRQMDQYFPIQKAIETNILKLDLDSLTTSRKIVFDNESVENNDHIKSVLQAMITKENDLLTERRFKNHIADVNNSQAVIIGSLLAFFFIVLILFQLNKDISLRKKAEDALQISGAKYRNLIENAGAVMYTTDQNGNITFASSRARELTGYTLEELTGKNFSALVDPHWIKKVVENYTNQYFLHTPETTMEFVAVTRTGEQKWVEQSAVLLMEDGRPTGFQCIVKDISDKKQMQLEMEASEFKLKESEFRLQSILDNTTSIMYIKDPAGRYIVANKRFKEIIGLTDKEILNKTDYDICPKEMADHYRAFDEEVLRTKKSIEIEETLQTDKGEIKLLLTKFPLLDNNNNVFGISGIAADITERMHYQQQLVEAKKDAEEAKKMQEQFLANMSHEIRTPMNGIQGMTNLLLDTDLTEQQKEFAAIIKRSSNNLLVIINDILDFSKIKAGKLAIENIEFNPMETVYNAVSVFNHRLTKKGLIAAVEVENEIPIIVSGDPYRLNQVLLNLIGNAIKFTDSGSITIGADVQQNDGDNVILFFTVTDTGIGIPSERIPYIFDSFSQAGADITRRYGGTGLGLTICKQLLQLQGGDITVTSMPGKGTSFQFYIPYKNAGKTENNQPVLSDETDFAKILQGKKFLVAEDNEVNQKLIEYVLKKIGGEVFIAGNGQEAIEALQKCNDYDLIVLDLQMPVMDGYAATRYIRNVMNLRIPIIAMTATALKGEQSKCLAVGMNDYMPKPFEFPDLYKRIAKLLGKYTATEPILTKPSLNKPGLFDLSLLEELNDTEYLLDVLNIFLLNTPSLLEEMSCAASEKNFERIYYLAHKLKGSTGMLQANALFTTLEKIEQNARESKDMDVLEQMILVAGNDYSALELGLQEHKKNIETDLRMSV